MIPESFHGIWEEYCAYMEKMETPQEKRYRQIHNGHCTFLMSEGRRFMAPQVLQGICLVGEPEGIINQIRRAEKDGFRGVNILPPMVCARKVLKDFADQVMKRVLRECLQTCFLDARRSLS